MNRSFGWIEDDPDGRDFRFSARLAKPAAAAPSPSLLQYRARRLEQDGVGACVGFALARAIHVCLLAAGNTHAPEPSPLFLYFNGRSGKYAGQDPATVPALADEGCQPRTMMQATRAMGFCREAEWPFEPTLRNTRPKLRCYRRAYDQRGLEFYRIDTIGAKRVLEVKLALTLGYPVIFGMSVDQKFCELRGSTPVDDIGDPVGRHMMTVLAWDGAMVVDNFWGADWGFTDGFGRISDELFGSYYVTDVYAIRAAAVPPGA